MSLHRFLALCHKEFCQMLRDPSSFLIGIVINFLRGWITDFMTAYVQKQQGVKLSKELAPAKS